jgi:hypothetical protein
MKSCILLAFFILVLSMDVIIAQGASGNNGNGNGNNGNGNGNSNNGNGNGNSGNIDTTDYKVLAPEKTGEERAYCNAKGSCNSKTLKCPSQCPKRKPKHNKKTKGCFVDCSSKCEVTCKCKHPLLQLFIMNILINIINILYLLQVSLLQTSRAYLKARHFI